ncbi:DNA-binding protein [Halovenus salina]|uniref:DNA-binding protein n=1 Tax=Halovenus salina TaxID=1510225 RepID=A0ABD5W6M8_9EURY
MRPLRGAYDNNWPHPSGEQLAENPDGWDGQQVLLFGTVTEQTTTGFVMHVEKDDGEIARVVEVRGSNADVETGGVVQVHGTLSDSGTVQTAESVVVVNEGPGDQRYKLGASVAGVLLVVGAFLRYWHIDLRRMRFVAREGGEHDG